MHTQICVCVCSCSLSCCVIAASLLCVCLTFHNCIITRSVSCKKWVHRNLQHMLQADRHLPLIMDLGGMASSSGCLDSPQHVGRHMLLWVNLIDWMAPNSQVQVSSGSQSESVQVKDELRRWSPPPNTLAWASSHMPLVSPSDISGRKLAKARHKVTPPGSSLIRNVRMDRRNETHPAPNSTSNLIISTTKNVHSPPCPLLMDD